MVVNNQSENGRTAILFFARTAKREGVEKRLSESTRRNKSLFSLLTKSTKTQLNRTGLDVYFWSEKFQKGNTFSERFTHAFQEIFEKGYSSIISVGNDTPELDLKDLLKAKYELKKGKRLVLGPSEDGGVYLIGMSRDIFEPEAFCNHSWQTDRVFNELKSYCASVTILNTKRDLDNIQNILLFLKEQVAHSAIARMINDVLLSITSERERFHDKYSFLFEGFSQSRPPPYL